MRRPLIGLAVGVAAIVGLTAQTGFRPWRLPEGGNVSGFVVLCATDRGREAGPCGTVGFPLNVMSMPFTRLHSKPIRLKNIGPTPKTFAISRPPEATTYRIVVPCDVNIRVLGTMTEAESVTEDTGVLYLANTDVTMGTSRPNFISAMTVGTPTGDCTPEMHYGMGGG